ncbi:transposase [Planktothrix paucivesiculata PCC 9631]|uniref:Transposase n=1 Tax=Planktothrix paucivesiculata PCC 9631 TaxID=671071 RepID=A0A7Z9BZ53_9CYAN|nr:transposase [Planktothrix paucivesiculata PCC 9631]
MVTSIERTAYPRFKRQLTAQELTEIYTPKKSEIALAYATTQGESNILNLLCLLKSFQRLGYFPSLVDIPLKIVAHIRSSLKFSVETVLGYENRKTLYRHRTAIREYLQVNQFNQTGLHLAIKAVNESATIMDNPADLMNVAIAELVKNRYELPGFNTLNRLVRRVRNVVNQRLFSQVLSRISSDYQERLLDLLERHPLEYKTAFNSLKQLPKSPTRNNINDFIVHLIWLDSVGDVQPILKDLTTAKIHHFAAEARVLDAHEIKDFSLSKRMTLILCLIYASQVTARDSLVEMFLKQMRSINNDATKELELIKKRIQETQEKLVEVLTNVLHVFIDENQLTHEQVDSHLEREVSDSYLSNSLEQIQELNLSTKLLKNQEISLFHKLNNIFTQDGGAEQLLSECEAMNAYRGNNHLPLIWKFYKNHRQTFFRLVKALEFKSTTTEQSVIEALQFVLDNSHRRGEFLTSSIELDFISEQWRKLIVVKQGEKTKFVRRHFEACIFYYLAAELRSGDICVVGSEDYADYREQLLPWSECLPLVDQYCENVGFPNNASEFTKTLKSWLTDTAASVDAGYPNNHQFIINDQGSPILKKYQRNELSVAAKALIEKIEELFPERNLIDILRNVDYWTNFTRHFGPLSGSDPKIERATERYLLTTFTYGCNLGPAQAARHMRGIVTAKELAFVNRRHVTVDKLNAALVDIINRYNALNLPKVWGDGKSAAADGTKYELYEENLLSEYHIRYGGYGGIAYHHVSDTYVALFSQFISCGTWEAVHIIEGLLKNSSDIQPDTIHADTHGQSTPVFALAHMLGIKLMPRIRNWKDLNFYRPDKDTVYQHIDSLFSETVNWKRIETHWQDILQVVLSIQTGKVSSAILLRKLGNYSRKNRLYQAFQSLGQVVRTVFLLQYISDMQLRKEITAVTNIVEAYHKFSKWFFFGGFGVVMKNDPIEQEKVIKYKDLVANAVLFQNVVDLTDILRDLQKQGYLISREDVAVVSPYITAHVKRFGDYLIDLETVPPSLDEVESLVLA